AHADFQIQSFGGPDYLATVYSPCQGSAALFQTVDGRFTGSEPDFMAASLCPILVDGEKTWELLVLGFPNSGCRPAKKFRQVTPDEYADGDYCMLYGGCEAGTAAVFIP